MEATATGVIIGRTVVLVVVVLETTLCPGGAVGTAMERSSSAVESNTTWQRRGFGMRSDFTSFGAFDAAITIKDSLSFCTLDEKFA